MVLTVILRWPAVLRGPAVGVLRFAANDHPGQRSTHRGVFEPAHLRVADVLGRLHIDAPGVSDQPGNGLPGRWIADVQWLSAASNDCRSYQLSGLFACTMGGTGTLDTHRGTIGQSYRWCRGRSAHCLLGSVRLGYLDCRSRPGCVGDRIGRGHAWGKHGVLRNAVNAGKHRWTWPVGIEASRRNVAIVPTAAGLLSVARRSDDCRHARNVARVPVLALSGRAANRCAPAGQLDVGGSAARVGLWVWHGRGCSCGFAPVFAGKKPRLQIAQWWSPVAALLGDHCCSCLAAGFQYLAGRLECLS